MIRPKVQRTPWNKLEAYAWKTAAPGTSIIERCAIWIPGYDCRSVCEHTPPQKSNHGQHGDEIHAVVRSRVDQKGLCTPLEFATNLAIFTHVRRGEAEIGFMNLTEPASISLHASHKPFSLPEAWCVPERSGWCEYLWNGSCFNAGYSALQADEIWDKYVEIDFNQEALIAGSCAPRLLEIERVWTRLVAWHHDAVTYFIAERKDDART